MRNQVISAAMRPVSIPCSGTSFFELFVASNLARREDAVQKGRCGWLIEVPMADLVYAVVADGKERDRPGKQFWERRKPDARHGIQKHPAL
jgi:hypothetical protein